MPTPTPLSRRKRTYNLCLIKMTWPYTVQEIATLFGVHKNAVGRWMAEGLQADRQQRPFLIRGDELTRFLGSRQTKRRTKCGPAQFYCFKCRAARAAAAGHATAGLLVAGKVRLQAICEHCGTRMNKVLGIKKLQQIQSCLIISKSEGEHIIECSEASVNDDLEMQS